MHGCFFIFFKQTSNLPDPNFCLVHICLHVARYVESNINMASCTDPRQAFGTRRLLVCSKIQPVNYLKKKQKKNYMKNEKDGSLSLALLTVTDPSVCNRLDV